MSASDDLLPIPPQPEISEGNEEFHKKTYSMYKWMREKLGPAIIEVVNLIRNAVTGAFTSASADSFAITTGDVSITIGTGRSFVPGTSIRAAYVTDPTKYVDGIVKAYDGSTGAMVFARQTTSGSGTYANWSISIIAASGSFASLISNKFTGLQTLANEVTIASATTIDLTSAGSNQFKLTGVVPVTGATMPQSAVIKGRAADATPLVNSSSFKVQGGADYTCTVGDWLELKKDGDGNIHISITPSASNPIKLKTSLNDSGLTATSGNPVADDWVLALINKKIGASYQYVDKTSSRATSTIYTNTEDAPRDVFIYRNNASPTGTLFVESNTPGVYVGVSKVDPTSTESGGSTASARVDPQKKYYFDAGFASWVERTAV